MLGLRLLLLKENTILELTGSDLEDKGVCVCKGAQEKGT